MAQELCNMTKPSVYKSQRAINPQKLDSHSNVYKGGIYITWHWKTDIPTVTLEKKIQSFSTDSLRGVRVWRGRKPEYSG